MGGYGAFLFRTIDAASVNVAHFRLNVSTTAMKTHNLCQHLSLWHNLLHLSLNLPLPLSLSLFENIVNMVNLIGFLLKRQLERQRTEANVEKSFYPDSSTIN